jgi:excisionase family DNA binding protein
MHTLADKFPDKLELAGGPGADAFDDTAAGALGIPTPWAIPMTDISIWHAPYNEDFLPKVLAWAEPPEGGERIVGLRLTSCCRPRRESVIERELRRWQTTQYFEFEREYLSSNGTPAMSRKSTPKAVPVPRDSNALLKPDEAAARLGITVEQLLAHVEDGALRYINVGRGQKKPRYRFSETDLNEFISTRSTLEQRLCPSSSPKRASRITGTASKSNVVGFSALHAASLAKRPRGSKR